MLDNRRLNAARKGQFHAKGLNPAMSGEYKPSFIMGPLMSARVSALLLKELKNGAFSQAEKLPAEVELAQWLGVSRTVIRDALSDIEREGFIERVRGVGTVINRNIVNLSSRLDLKLEYNDLIRSAGHVPKTDMVSLRTQAAPRELADKLDIVPGTEILVCEKRLLADGVPVVYSVDYLPADLFGQTDYLELDWSNPIFDILENVCGLRSLFDVTEVSAVLGSDAIRKKLEVKPGEALLKLDEVDYCQRNRPLLYAQEYFTNYLCFSMLRKKF